MYRKKFDEKDKFWYYYCFPLGKFYFSVFVWCTSIMLRKFSMHSWFKPIQMELFTKQREKTAFKIKHWGYLGLGPSSKSRTPIWLFLEAPKWNNMGIRSKIFCRSYLYLTLHNIRWVPSLTVHFWGSPLLTGHFGDFPP